MAARVPRGGVTKNGSRPQARTASRTPSPGAPRYRNGSSARRPASGRKPAKGRGGYGRNRYGRGKTVRRPPSADPFLILFGWIGRVIVATWMVAAHAVGAGGGVGGGRGR
jgi:hypothetical protein